MDKDGTIPSVVIKIISVDGKEYKDNVILSAEDAYFVKDTLELQDGEQTMKQSDDMIYEFVNVGTTVKEKMEN